MGYILTPTSGLPGYGKKNYFMAVVVPQLVERLLPNPEVPGSNLVISKNLYRTFTVNSIEKAKIKKKRPGMAHFLEKVLLYKSPPGPAPAVAETFSIMIMAAINE